MAVFSTLSRLVKSTAEKSTSRPGIALSAKSLLEKLAMRDLVIADVGQQ